MFPLISLCCLLMSPIYKNHINKSLSHRTCSQKAKENPLFLILLPNSIFLKTLNHSFLTNNNILVSVFFFPLRFLSFQHTNQDYLSWFNAYLNWKLEDFFFSPPDFPITSNQHKEKYGCLQVGGPPPALGVEAAEACSQWGGRLHCWSWGPTLVHTKQTGRVI